LTVSPLFGGSFRCLPGAKLLKGKILLMEFRLSHDARHHTFFLRVSCQVHGCLTFAERPGSPTGQQTPDMNMKSDQTETPVPGSVQPAGSEELVKRIEEWKANGGSYNAEMWNDEKFRALIADCWDHITSISPPNVAPQPPRATGIRHERESSSRGWLQVLCWASSCSMPRFSTQNEDQLE
jgi:hypothetical protein